MGYFYAATPVHFYSALDIEAHWQATPMIRWANFRPIIPLKYDYFHADPEADGFRYTAPVGALVDRSSPYGVLDLAGNVTGSNASRFSAGGPG